MDKFITNIEELPKQLQNRIKEGLQSQIIAQAVFIRDELPQDFLAYVDEEISKATKSMFKMVEESSREGAELGAISETYIWNKERKKTLIRLRDEAQAEPKHAAPEPQQKMQEILANNDAKKYLAKAMQLGLIDANYKWLKGLQLLACFAMEMSLRLKLGKGVNSNGQPRISWKPFENLFGVPSGKLRLNLNDIQKTGQDPKEIELINKVFE